MNKTTFKLTVVLTLLCLGLSSCGVEHYFRSSNAPNVLFPTIPKGETQKDVAADVHVQQNSSSVPLVSTAVAGENLLNNPSFENGVSDWGVCDGAAQLLSSTEASSGLKSAQLTTGCLYQSVQVDAGQDISFSCHAKVTNATGWSGLGLSFADADWMKVADAPSQTLTGDTYRDYVTTSTAPIATKYASIWAYTDGSINLDDCKVFFGEPAAPAGNLLLNGSFDSANATQTAWNSCGEADNYTLNGQLNITGQACLYQTVNARADLSYKLSCNSKSDGSNWSSMILSMLNENWETIVEDYAQIDSTNFSEKSIVLTTPSNARHVAVTFYNEGVSTYESCSLTATSDTLPPEPVDDSLVGHWTFDETSGETALDSSSYENNANVLNGDWATGQVSGALSMNGGDNSIVRIPLSDSLRSTGGATGNKITVMAWGYRTANHNVALISHGYPDLFFGYHGPQYKWQIRNQDGTFAACYAGNAPLNEWQHLVGTFDGSSAKLFVNGVEICSKTLTGAIPMSESPFLISGYINGNGQIIDEITGKIDDVRIYNRALSATEIQEVYNAATQ